MKKLPNEMKDWYFPFNWNVSDLWGLPGSLESRKFSDLEWHLDIPFWSSERGKGMTFDLKPIDVLINPALNDYHYRRLTESDESFPICVASHKGNEIIIDGIHRLAKLKLQNTEIVNVKVLNENEIQRIAISA